MPDVTTALRGALEQDLVDGDGDPVDLAFAPAATSADVEAIERAAGVPLPAELREALAVTRALDGPLDGVDFTGESSTVDPRELLPHALGIARDGFGNEWFADLAAGPDAPVRIYFLCHDPAVLVLQSHSLAEFVAQIVALYTPPHASAINAVTERATMDAWDARKQPAITHAHALAEAGPLSELAATLDDTYEYFDLRKAQVGDGFAWARSRHDDLLARHTTDPVFAVAPAPRRPGRLARLRRV